MGRLRWKGAAVKRKMQMASIIGINRTLGESVTQAKMHHPWQNRSVTLEPGIKVIEGAAVRGRFVSGRWGVALVDYAKHLEKNPKWAWLVPAAKNIYPRLARNIKAALRG